MEPGASPVARTLKRKETRITLNQVIILSRDSKPWRKCKWSLRNVPSGERMMQKSQVRTPIDQRFFSFFLLHYLLRFYLHNLAKLIQGIANMTLLTKSLNYWKNNNNTVLIIVSSSLHTTFLIYMYKWLWKPLLKEQNFASFFKKMNYGYNKFFIP